MRSRVSRALALALPVSAVVGLVAVPNAAAHGLFLTPALPIPVWLFAVIAAVVVVVSFATIGALWSEARLADRGWRPLTPWIGRGLAHPVTEIVSGAIGIGVLLLVIYAGLQGIGDGEQNFAAVFVFVIFWAGLPLVTVMLGDVFRAFNPWRAIGRLVGRAAHAYVRPPEGSQVEPLLTYPQWLGRFPAAAGLLGFAFLEIASTRSPRDVGLAALLYSAVTLVAMSLFGVEQWCARGETFSVYFNLFSRIGVLERRGSRLGVRRPLSALANLDPAPGTVVLVAVMIGAVSFDGASGSTLWQHPLPDLITGLQGALGLGAIAAQEWASFLGILIFSAASWGVFALGIAGARLVGGELGVSQLAHRFAPSLVPIALAYLVAHNLTLLVIGGQSLIPTLSDPLGHGANLLGTANFKPDQSVLSAQTYWYLEVGAIVAGHVAAVALAHDLALSTYRRVRQAVRSQYPMLMVMVAFTIFALWLLKEASEL